MVDTKTPTPVQSFWGTIWDDVQADVKSSEAWIKSEAAKIAAAAEKDASAMFGTVETDLKAAATSLFPEIKQAVLEQMPKVTSGEEKLGTAATAVFQLAEARALPLALGDCTALVQMFWSGMSDIIALL